MQRITGAGRSYRRLRQSVCSRNLFWVVFSRKSRENASGYRADYVALGSRAHQLLNPQYGGNSAQRAQVSSFDSVGNQGWLQEFQQQ